jgi:hypothetical protein
VLSLLLSCCAVCFAGALLLTLRTGHPTRSAPPGVLDSKEQAFLQRALQPDVALRPSAAQLLDADPYIKFGPECVAAPAAAARERRIARGWEAVEDMFDDMDMP